MAVNAYPLIPLCLGGGPPFLEARNTPWLPHPSRFSMGGRGQRFVIRNQSAGHDMATTPPMLSQKMRKDGAASIKIPTGKGGTAPNRFVCNSARVRLVLGARHSKIGDDSSNIRRIVVTAPRPSLRM